MSPFAWGLIAGFFVGVFLGVMLVGICVMSRDEDKPDATDKVFKT